MGSKKQFSQDCRYTSKGFGRKGDRQTIQLKDKDGQVAIDLARKNGHSDMVELIEFWGASLNVSEANYLLFLSPPATSQISGTRRRQRAL